MHEHAGAAVEDPIAQHWDAIVPTYERFVGPIARRSVDLLLNAAGVRAGMRVLDLGTGPGYAAGRAALRGARAIGIDISNAMLDAARRSYGQLAPLVEFRRADAHALPFEDGAFEAVVANFAFLSLSRPEAMTREAFRVLCGGGRGAWTAYDTPAQCDLMRLVCDAIDAAAPGALQPLRAAQGDDLPLSIVAAAGFEGVRLQRAPLLEVAPDAAWLWEHALAACRPIAAVVAGLPAQDRTAVFAAFERGCEGHRTADGIVVPMSMRLVSARKP